MENTKIGNKEAIALLTTISFNQIIIFGVKSIINNTSSASLLNLLYLSIIILIFTILICYLLNKFPSFDLLDISDYLGGKILKWIVGILFFIYFIICREFTSSVFFMFRNNIFSFNSTDFYKIIFNNRCYYYLLIQK